MEFRLHPILKLDSKVDGSHWINFSSRSWRNALIGQILYCFLCASWNLCYLIGLISPLNCHFGEELKLPMFNTIYYYFLMWAYQNQNEKKIVWIWTRNYFFFLELRIFINCPEIIEKKNDVSLKKKEKIHFFWQIDVI